MYKNQIREYILKYKRNYTKNQIIKSLTNSGYQKKDVEEVYKKLTHSRVASLGESESNSPIAIILVIILLLISLIFFFI